MVDRVLLETLATAPGHRWSKLIHRHAVVAEFTSLRFPPPADADHYSNLLGVSTRMFYRYLKQYKQTQSGVAAPSTVNGRGRPLSAIQEALIRRVTKALPATATTSEVVTEVRRTSLRAAVTPPSSFAVISRLRETTNLAALQRKLPRTCRWIIDDCQIDLHVIDEAGRASRGWILALIDCQRGLILSHRFCAKRPTTGDRKKVLWSLPASSSDSLPELRSGSVIQTSRTRDNKQNKEGLSSLPKCNNRSALMPGEALLLTLGQKIGNLSLRPRARHRQTSNQTDGAPLDIATAVIAHLVQQHNERSKSAVKTFPTSSSPDHVQIDQ